MTTIYIQGRDKKKKAVRKALLKSELVEGDHYIEGNHTGEFLLYWITSRITLKEFKIAIGSKIVWKYRLEFYESVESTMPKKKDELTDEDWLIISEYQNK